MVNCVFHGQCRSLPEGAALAANSPLQSHMWLWNVKLVVTAARPTRCCIILPVEKNSALLLLSSVISPFIMSQRSLWEWRYVNGAVVVCGAVLLFAFMWDPGSLLEKGFHSFPGVWVGSERSDGCGTGEVMCGKHRNNIQLTATPRPAPLMNTITRPFAFQQLQKSFGN